MPLDWTQWERDHAIHCPYCDAKFDDEEYSHVSYHGTEYEPMEQDCGSCERTFYVHEIVDRTYRTVKNKDTGRYEDEPDGEVLSEQ